MATTFATQASLQGYCLKWGIYCMIDSEIQFYEVFFSSSTVPGGLRLRVETWWKEGMRNNRESGIGNLVIGLLGEA
ncbi:hypothetical protein L873DRAFT_1809112 [Choiromyces venosus 120613-1]|uniref:Uncharacterized protein n=1 Tax=Choiromyces venosus 120613-1 TaxID=1336337 RepID=A0A3N4JLV4_9PEZI|nr:hypothetical protein L873DRAFT_1809112 [Choiromyces venosus 120613-1]